MDRELSPKDMAEAVNILVNEKAGWSDLDARGFLRTAYQMARGLHRLYEKECNEPLTDLDRERMERLESQVRGWFKDHGVGLYLQDDPRGNPVGFLTPLTGKYNTMGGAECGWRL